ncbi:MAG: hypothetical protein AB1523_09590 [Bacillota bacterium]
MKLKFIGDYEKFFPGFGIYKPGQSVEVDDEKAKELLSTGSFQEARQAQTKKDGDE